jgi:alpha-L-fucosidase
VRWVGNEKGIAFESTWYGLDRAATYPGDPRYAPELARGRIDASDYVPPEVDVSIRPGWFHHPGQDSKVKTVDQLLEIYDSSVGRGANLLLNIPPDRRGLIPEIDAARLREFRRALDTAFARDLARDAAARASAERGRSGRFAATRAIDGDAATYWATDDGVAAGSVELSWKAPVRFERVVLQEAMALGQRVEGWQIDVQVDGAWRPVAEGTSIGYKRITRFAPVTASAVRVSITAARACPTLTTIGVY